MTPAANGAARAGVRGQWGVLAFILVGLGVIAAVLLLLARGSGGSDQPYSVRSNAPGGLMGLRLWLEDMGYQVEVGYGPDTANADVIFLFPDADVLHIDQLRRLATRVEGGRTLVLADMETLEAQQTFGALIQRSQPIVEQPLTQTQPLLPAAGELNDQPVSGRNLGKMPGSHLFPVLQTADGRAAVLLERRGDGAVWHVGIAGAFTNAELAHGWSRALTLAVLRGKPSGSTVYIVNGEIEGPNNRPVVAPGGEINGLWDWLRSQPLGWAVLLLTGLVLFYLFTQGRRLGPPVVVSDPHRRRAAVEHIEAMAALAQRAGHRDGVAAYQKGRLKRRLGQAWRVSAELDDAAFVGSLAEQARLTPEKAHELAELLARLDHVKDEGALVELVGAAAYFAV